MPELKLNHGFVTLYQGDARHMTALQDGVVQAVVTSPPYWGLRQYAGPCDQIWGGDPDCPHEWEESSRKMIHHKDKGLPAWGDEHYRGGGKKAARLEDEIITSGVCVRCGAWRGSFGNEPTIQMYIEHSIIFLREVRRVLRKDGLVFWNIGDTYAGSWGDYVAPGSQKHVGQSASRWNLPGYERAGYHSRPPSAILHGNLKKKDLCLIPQRLAIAAQDDGWWLRSIIIWEKANCKPESVKDRPTISHEYILMLAKSARPYWDYDAGLTPYTGPLNRWGGPEYKDETERGRTYRDDVLGGTGSTSLGRKGRPVRPNPKGSNMRSVWRIKTDSFDLEMCLSCRAIYNTAQYRCLAVKDEKRVCECGAQDWLSHFAVFPLEIPKKIIKVATPEGGCCSKCGKPWTRGVEYKPNYQKRVPAHAPNSCPTKVSSTGWCPPDRLTTEWHPACKCGAPPVPSLVLDPFAGTGTTLRAASELGRKAVGHEISEDYCDLIIYRNRQGALV